MLPSPVFRRQRTQTRSASSRRLRRVALRRLWRRTPRQLRRRSPRRLWRRTLRRLWRRTLRRLWRRSLRWLRRGALRWRRRFLRRGRRQGRRQTLTVPQLSAPHHSDTVPQAHSKKGVKVTARQSSDFNSLFFLKLPPGTAFKTDAPSQIVPSVPLTGCRP